MRKQKIFSVFLAATLAVMVACSAGESKTVEERKPGTPGPSVTLADAGRIEQPVLSVSPALDTFGGQGNLSGNITNGGFAAESGENVFFATIWGIYRTNEDGSGMVKLTEDSAVYLNATEDWLYYASRIDARDYYAKDFQIYRISHDGKNKEALGETIYACDGLIYYDGWLYYSALSGREITINETYLLEYLIERDGAEHHEGVYSEPYPEEVYALYRMSSDGKEVQELVDNGGVGAMPIYLDGSRLYYAAISYSHMGEIYYLRCYWLDTQTLETTEVPISEYPSSENDDEDSGERIVDPVLGRIGLWRSILAHDSSLFLSDAGGTGGDHNYLMEVRMDAPKESRQLFVGQGNWAPAVIQGDWMYYFYAREYYPMEDIEAMDLPNEDVPAICRTHLKTGKNQIVYACPEEERWNLRSFNVLGECLYFLPDMYPPFAVKRLQYEDGSNWASSIETVFEASESVSAK